MAEQYLATITKELETYLRCLESPLGQDLFVNKTVLFFNPHSNYRHLISDKFDIELCEHLLSQSTHKVDGEQWSCGSSGSRWMDATINGHLVRLAFYSKKNNPLAYASLPMLTANYGIMIDPF